MSIFTLTLAVAGLLSLISLLLLLIRTIESRVILNKRLKRTLSSRDQYEFLLCDLRSPELYEKGHIPFSVSFPADEVAYLPVEDMFLTIILYGNNRKQSRIAADYLSRNGYFNVIPFGSLRSWRGPLEVGEGKHISQFEIKKGAL